MVCSGKFTLELIDAVTNRPFTEHHGKDGKTYAEVEPEIEYFLRISSTDPRSVCCKFSVDDKDLGYVCSLHQNNVSIRGIWSRENAVSKMSTLKFNKLINRRNGDSHNNKRDRGQNWGEDNIHWTGCVEMKIYELVVKERMASIYSDVSSSWSANTEHVLKGLNLSSNKKALNSTVGSTTIEKKLSGRQSHVSCGDHITSIKLYYCSTVGLIAAKVLDPPPRHEDEERQVPRDDISSFHKNTVKIDEDDNDEYNQGIVGKRPRIE